MTGLRFPKPAPKLLAKRQRAADRDAVDRSEDARVRRRSGGRCEVIEGAARCAARAVHIHHLRSGIGRRRVGCSVLAEHKLHVCLTAHAEIHNHVLIPCVSRAKAECAATVVYERIR